MLGDILNLCELPLASEIWINLIGLFFLEGLRPRPL